jgi:hypothetical protein
MQLLHIGKNTAAYAEKAAFFGYLIAAPQP